MEERFSAGRVGRPTRALKILMQNRPNAHSHPGGDTVVMDQLAQELSSLGHSVTVDLRGEKSPRDYDIVHIFNLVTASITEAFARRAKEQGTPYLVTALYEDWPIFFNQMHLQAQLLRQYVASGQREDIRRVIADALPRVQAQNMPDNSFTIEHAARVVTTGENESKAIRRDYPRAQNVVSSRLARRFSAQSDGNAFASQFGVRDFVLCVGRLEPRKNQLMLLKALEQSPLPIVFVNGDFSYDPDYDAAVRGFKRAGKNIFTGRLSAELLASAYAAAHIHILPSWYELPGLVSLEAAHHGRNVVVTDFGTSRDYFGDDAFYCRPDDAESIANAVSAAYYNPVREGARRRTDSLTWKRTAEDHLRLYEEILSPSGRTATAATAAAGTAGTAGTVGGGVSFAAMAQVAPLADTVQQATASVRSIPTAILSGIPAGAGDVDRSVRADALCVSANGIAREGKHEEALKLFTEAARIAPELARAHRGCGVMLLLLKRYGEAQSAFEKALVVDPQDNASKTGLGTVLWENGDKDRAFRLYQEVLRQNPGDGTALVYFTNAAYALDRLPQLQQVLEVTLRNDPDNADINFCLAGCYYKQGKLDDAERVNKHILRILPRYPNALELKRLIEEAREKLPPPSPGPALSDRLEIEQIKDARLFSSIELAQRFFAVEELHRARKYDEALSQLDEVERDRGLNSYEAALLKIQRGESLTCKGSLNEAEQLFTAAERVSELQFRAISGRGVIAAALDRWDEAERLFRESLRLQPSFDVALAGLGIVSQQKSDTEGAWDYFHKALAVNPENKRALFGVMQLGYPLRRLEAIETALSRYLDMNPGDLSMMYSLAGCRYAQGRLADAERELEKILLFEPSHELATELMATIRGEGTTARRHA